MPPVVIGIDDGPALPMEGTLPPDLEGILVRIGPSTGAEPGGDTGPGPGDGGRARGTLHAVELRDGRAVSYLARASDADETVLWHAGVLLALPEHGLPSQYSRLLEPEEFAGGLAVPVASHTHCLADGSRVLLSAEDLVVRIGECDARGALRAAREIEVERSTWHHDLAVTASHVAWIESPTRPLPPTGDGPSVPFRWDPGASSRLAVAPRDPDGSGVRWIGLDPCLVTHVLGAREIAPARTGTPWPELELYVCRYEAPEPGRPVDPAASVVGPAGVGLSPIAGGLAVAERWTVGGPSLEREQLDERHVEYPRTDPACDGADFRHGYCVETAWGSADAAEPVGLLKLDLRRDEVVSWHPDAGCRPSEPLFTRAADGRGDDEGWLLSVVDDPNRGGSDLYVLDASTLGRRRPEAVVHLPARLPLRSHGEWVPAERYR